MIIKALDQSLSCTGIATLDTATGSLTTSSFEPKVKGHDRLEQIWQRVLVEVTACDPVDAVAMEGISFGSPDTNRQLAGLSWFLRHELWRLGIEVIEIPPGNLKQYATGKGNANKDAVLMATIRRFPQFTGGNDESDAVVMAAMVADYCGRPIAAMPEVNRRGLNKVKWPDWLAAHKAVVEPA